MFRKLARVLVVGAVLATGSVAMGQPAQARSDGGCAGTVVVSCISLAGGTTLVGDMYINTSNDSSRCFARMQFIKSNGRVVWDPVTHDIRSGGWRGTLRNYIITAPPTSGSAITRTHIYRCDRNFHHWSDSERQNYP